MLRVDVSRSARQSIGQLDASLKDELIERVGEVAESPGEHLRRSRPPEPIDLWVCEFDSVVVEGLRVRLLFDRTDADAESMVLVGITSVIDADEDD